MNYSSLTVTELKALARNLIILGTSSMKKAELIESICKETERRERAEEKKAKEAEHTLSRQLQLRRQENVSENVATLEYPFSFLQSGEYSRECSPIPGEPEEDIENFPENIAEYFWIHQGENDEEPWLCLCKLTNDLYVFYKGECDYTGFDCQGDMKLYASKDPNILIQYAMTSTDYDLYIYETRVFQN